MKHKTFASLALCLMLALSHSYAGDTKTSAPKSPSATSKKEKKESAEELYNRGMSYTKQGNETEGIKLLKLAAEQGYPKAQRLFGLAYMGLLDCGAWGVKRDDKKAVKWLKRAAEQGDPGAQTNLGVMYSQGRGTKQDTQKAIKWLKRAAKQGNESSMFWLGFMYYQGKLVKKDEVKAYYWLAKAIKHGDRVSSVLILDSLCKESPWVCE